MSGVPRPLRKPNCDSETAFSRRDVEILFCSIFDRIWSATESRAMPRSFPHSTLLPLLLKMLIIWKFFMWPGISSSCQMTLYRSSRCWCRFGAPCLNISASSQSSPGDSLFCRAAIALVISPRVGSMASLFRGGDCARVFKHCFVGFSWLVEQV